VFIDCPTNLEEKGERRGRRASKGVRVWKDAVQGGNVVEK
jgi:hypothetical protein